MYCPGLVMAKRLRSAILETLLIPPTPIPIPVPVQTFGSHHSQETSSTNDNQSKYAHFQLPMSMSEMFATLGTKNEEKIHDGIRNMQIVIVS
jgi:hypothetical protein